MSKFHISDANSVETELIDSRFKFENIADLEMRLGLNEMLAGMQNEKLAKAIKVGLRRSLNSVLNTHQKIVQLVCNLQEEEAWQQVFKAFCKSAELETWRISYTESTRLLDNACQGMLSTLCGFLLNHTSDPNLEQSLSAFKDGEAGSELDKRHQIWGQGSLVHSLVDTTFVFCNDSSLEKHFKQAFVKDVKKKLEAVELNQSRFNAELTEIDSYFSQNLQYQMESVLDKAEKEFQALGKWRVVHISASQQFISSSGGSKANGYGWLMQDEEVVLKGEFFDGIASGLGEYYSEGKKVYLGQFSQSKPNGSGIFFRGDGRYRYFGQVLDGIRHGIGCEYHRDGHVAYKGQFFNDKKDGVGLLLGKDGKVVFRGEFKKGEMVNKH